MHARPCTGRTLFHLLWHPRTLFLDAEKRVFSRTQAPRNQVDAPFKAQSGCGGIQKQSEAALQRALYARLQARGVRLCATNVGFVRYAAKQDLLVCNFIGLCRNHIALVLGRECAQGKLASNAHLCRLQELLEPLLTTKTRLVFFVFCLRTWRAHGRLLLRRVSASTS